MSPTNDPQAPHPGLVDRAYRSVGNAEGYLRQAYWYSAKTIDYMKVLCNDIYDTYGRFPAHVDAFHVPGVWMQFSHLELEYYQKYFDPALYRPAGRARGGLGPRLMRQIVMTSHGPPSVLQAVDADDPTPRPGEIRVAVRAAGVNFADIMARLGLYPDAPRPPAVIGYEVAGLVDAVGSEDTPFRIGDRVFAFTRFGGYASSVVVPAASVFPTPPALSDVEAAAIPVNYLTAVIALYELANVAAGETVLIHGAGGGVGIAATQLAKLRGAMVIGTASAMKLPVIRSLGVDHSLDHQRDDVAGEVRKLTAGRGVDVVLDPIGGRSFAVSYGLLAPLGRLVLYGVSSLASGERRSLWRVARTMIAMPAFRPLSLMNDNRGVFGLNVGHLWSEANRLRRAMDRLMTELTANRIRPVVARTFDLEHAADAHRYLQSRGNIGKVVLTV